MHRRTRKNDTEQESAQTKMHIHVPVIRAHYSHEIRLENMMKQSPQHVSHMQCS